MSNQCDVLLLEATLLNFCPMHWHRQRGLDPKLYGTTLDSQDSNSDVVADDDGFIRP